MNLQWMKLEMSRSFEYGSEIGCFTFVRVVQHAVLFFHQVRHKTEDHGTHPCESHQLQNVRSGIAILRRNTETFPELRIDWLPD
jgi:hypothetical protein